jgi:hypothetical protein
VPKDYDNPRAGTMDLAVAKSPATNQCTDTAVEAYLFSLTLPAQGTKCAQDQPPFPAPAAAAKSLSRAARR